MATQSIKKSIDCQDSIAAGAIESFGVESNKQASGFLLLYRIGCSTLLSTTHRFLAEIYVWSWGDKLLQAQNSSNTISLSMCVWHGTGSCCGFSEHSYIQVQNALSMRSQ